MTDVVIFGPEDFTADPGILFSSATPAVRRPYDGTNDRWTADCIGRISETSWAYVLLEGPRSGLTDLHSFSTIQVRHNLAGGTWDNNGKGYFGYHHNPTGEAAPDLKNFVGYAIYKDGAGNREIQAILYDENGNLFSGNVISLSTSDLGIDIIYESDTRQIRVRPHNWGGAIIGTSTINVSSVNHFNSLTVWGSRDNNNSDNTVLMQGWIDDLSALWLIPEDEWVLYVPGYGAVIFNNIRTWNKDQPSRNTIISGLGRPWSSIYWDGADPLWIRIDGTLQRSPHSVLDDIHELLVAAKANGYDVQLYSPETFYTLLDARVIVWDFPRPVQRLDNRDYLLEVWSRREPQIS